MSSELTKKLENYRKVTTTELSELTKERQDLLDKIQKGEALTWTENKRNQKLAKLINEKFEIIKLFEQYDLCKKVESDLKTISSGNSAGSLNVLLKKLQQIIDNNEIVSIEIDGLSEEVIDLEKVKTEIEEDIKELEFIIKRMEKKNLITTREEKELQKKKDILEKINSHLTCDINIKEATTDLIKAVKSQDKKERNSLTKKYKNYVNKSKENIANKICDEIEKNKTIKTKLTESSASLKNRTKDTLAKTSETLKKHRKKIVAVGGLVVLCVVVGVAAKSCSRNNGPAKNPTGIESEYDNNKALIEELMTYGVDKNTAFQYATADGFNIDYLNDYEATRIKYGITAPEAVDYVNRSYSIQTTNFYEGATIDQIVEVVKAIDNKEVFTQDNANIAQSFNTTFNRIVDNRLFGVTTEADIAKLDALPHFAKEGSDMDKFLTEFATISKKVISNPADIDSKNEMYKYLSTYALSLNGFTNEDPDFPVEKPYNENAQLNDYYDWYIAYNSFIAPLYPTFVDENSFAKYEDLQILMVSVFNDPGFEEYMEHICGQSRSLGGK